MDSLSLLVWPLSLYYYYFIIEQWMNELNHSPSPLFFFLKKNYFICLVKYIPFYALPLNVQFFNFNYLHFCFHLSRRRVMLYFVLPINQMCTLMTYQKEWIRNFHTLPVAHVIISLLISNHSTSGHKTLWLQQISYNQNDILQSLPHEWELFTFYERPRVRFFCHFPLPMLTSVVRNNGATNTLTEHKTCLSQHSVPNSNHQQTYSRVTLPLRQ